jgi:predicted aconitase with swiveling domain
MARAGTAPAAIVNAESEAIVALGAIMAGIPMVDQIDISQIRSGDLLHLRGERLEVGR